MNKRILFTSIILLTLAVGGFYFSDRLDNTNYQKVVENEGFGFGQKITLYKSPTCGCCVGYADVLKKQGFEVNIIPTEDINSVKDKYNISVDQQSCHTIAMGDYFIEGHVPMEAVEKLLKERPGIEGIGLPRMPAGAPGMGGSKHAPYEVYQIKDGVVSSFITI